MFSFSTFNYFLLFLYLQHALKCFVSLHKFYFLSLSFTLTSRRSSPPALTKLVDLLLPPLISTFSFSPTVLCGIIFPFKTRGRVFYGGEVCSAPILGRTLFTFLWLLRIHTTFRWPRLFLPISTSSFLLLLMHVFLYPRSVYCKPNSM